MPACLKHTLSSIPIVRTLQVFDGCTVCLLIQGLLCKSGELGLGELLKLSAQSLVSNIIAEGSDRLFDIRT